MCNLARRWFLATGLLLACVGGLAQTPVTPPALMLAGTFKAGTHLPDYWVSEKLDGVRGHWTGWTVSMQQERAERRCYERHPGERAVEQPDLVPRPADDRDQSPAEPEQEA